MRARVYIVDDEIMAVRYMKRLLEELDCVITGEAYNGVRAIPDILRLKPDIVFVDISMPVMDGLKMASKILKKNPGQKIVVLTSYKSFEYVQEGLKIGISDYILKNEMNQNSLGILIDRIMEQLEKEYRERDLIRQHNLRLFLQSKGDENYVNESKNGRVALISVKRKSEIRLKYEEENREFVHPDCYMLSRLTYPQGVMCQAVVEMDMFDLCGVFYLGEQVVNTGYILEKTAYILRNGLETVKNSYTCIATDAVYDRGKLPGMYRSVQKMQGMMYSHAVKDVYMQSELEEICLAKKGECVSKEVLTACLEKEEREEAGECLRKVIESAGSYMNIWEFTEEIQGIYHMICEFARRKKVMPEQYEMKNAFDSIEDTEKRLEDYLNWIFDKAGEQNVLNYSSYTRMALKYIWQNYNRDISVPDIAAYVGISEGHLRKCFRQDVSEKIVDYLMNYRLEKAKKFIKSGENRLDVIWKKAGFMSAQYFSYAFRKKEGISPREYMRGLNQNEK